MFLKSTRYQLVPCPAQADAAAVVARQALGLVVQDRHGEQVAGVANDHQNSDSLGECKGTGGGLIARAVVIPGPLGHRACRVQPDDRPSSNRALLGREALPTGRAGRGYAI